MPTLTAPALPVTDEQRAGLRRLAASSTSPHRQVVKAKAGRTRRRRPTTATTSSTTRATTVTARGTSPSTSKDTKRRYGFPYGDFKKVNRAALIHANQRAAQNDHNVIEKAADELPRHLDDKAGRRDHGPNRQPRCPLDLRSRR